MKNNLLSTVYFLTFLNIIFMNQNKQKTEPVPAAEQSKTSVLAVVKSEPKKPTFEDKLKQLTKGNTLIKNFNKLNQKAKELDSLNFPEDEANISLIFTDDKGNEWETNHPKIISLTRDYLHEAFLVRLSELQEEIENLTI